MLLGVAVCGGLMALGASTVGASTPGNHVIGAYVYFTRATGNTRRLQKGTVWFTFRTSRALQLEGGTLGGDATIAGSDAFPFVISRRLHCYGALVDVGTDGKALPSGGHALPGDRVAVSIGKHGSLYRHRLVVGKMRADSARGAKLGCGADPASRAELFNLTEEPEFEPDRYFFSANAGPYVKDIKWSGWGRDTAEGEGHVHQRLRQLRGQGDHSREADPQAPRRLPDGRRSRLPRRLHAARARRPHEAHGHRHRLPLHLRFAGPLRGVHGAVRARPDRLAWCACFGRGRSLFPLRPCPFRRPSMAGGRQGGRDFIRTPRSR